MAIFTRSPPRKRTSTKTPFSTAVRCGSIAFPVRLPRLFRSSPGSATTTRRRVRRIADFAPSARGPKLRATLRARLRAGADSEEIVEVVRGAILQKWPGHPGAENLLALKNASMIQIGG